MCHFKSRLAFVPEPSPIELRQRLHNTRSSNNLNSKDVDTALTHVSPNNRGTISSSFSNPQFDNLNICRMFDNGLSYTRETFPECVAAPKANAVSTYNISVESFLTRPVLLRSYVITNTIYFIDNLNINDFFAHPMIADKINNYRFYRGNMYYKLVLNASVQALGRALIISSPYLASILPNRATNITTTVTQLTCFPHAELDFGSGESVTFKVPYMSVYPQSPITDVGWSDVQLWMMNTFAGLTAGETATLSVYGYMDDVSLVIPRAQSADPEMDAKTDKPISGALSKLSVFSKSIEFIPIVGTYATGLTWLSDLASKVASAYGYSKPPNDSSVTFVNNIPARSYTHADGCDNSVSLSIKPNNKVSVDPSNFGVKTDPHSLLNFLCREHILSQFTMSPSDLTNTILYSVTLNPTGLKQTLFATTTDFFNFYASSLIFRLSFVKNAFYSGRVAVEWVTNDLAPIATWSPANPSLIFDIKDNKELVFRVPFASAPRMLKDSETFGILIIRVINPLKVNGAYPQVIGANLSILVDQDYQVTSPINSTLAYAQGLTADEPALETTSNSIANRAVGMFPLPPLTPNNLATVGGEYITTLNDFLKRSIYDTTLTLAGLSMSYDPYDFSRNLTSFHPMQRFSTFFRFCRGSTRLKFVVTQPPSNLAGDYDNHCILTANLSITAVHFPPTTPAVAPTVLSFSPEHRVSHNFSNVLEISVPFYTQNDREIVGAASASNTPIVNFWITTKPTYTVAPIVDVYFSAGEDFSFGFPLYLPKMT